MLAASYRSIAHERTTIKFIISGFESHPDLKYFLTNRTSQPPGTIQDLMSMAMSTQSMAHYILSATPIQIIPTHAPNMLRSQHQFEPNPHIRTSETFTSHTRRRMSKPEVNYQFHAAVHGRILRHAESVCRNSDKTRGIHGQQSPNPYQIQNNPPTNPHDQNRRRQPNHKVRHTTHTM